MSMRSDAAAHFARQRLLPFTILTFPNFVSGEHIRKLARKLELVEQGKIKRLMVFMPPRHCKSLLCSERFPAWYLGRNPAKQIICATYGDDLARDFGRKVRNLIQTPEFALTFSSVQLATDSSAIDKFSTNHGGVYITTGIGGALTGRGADVLLIDDPIKNRQDADSEVMRNNVWGWYTSTARTRLMPDGAVILIQTRWHKDDLAGRLLQEQNEGGEKWDVVEFPAISEGVPLWPEFWPLEELEKTRKAIGAREWNCLYQQTPSDPEHQVFHPEMIRYYDELPPKSQDMIILMTVDPAFSQKNTSDNSAIVVVGVHDNMIYVLDFVNKKMNPSELINEIIRMHQKWRPHKLGIESIAAQQVIGFYLSDVGRQRGISIFYDEIKQNQNKLNKIKRLEPYFRTGKILIQKHHSELEKQLLEFPQGKHDDLIDALQMCFEFKTVTVMKQDQYWDDLGIINYNQYGEPIYD